MAAKESKSLNVRKLIYIDWNTLKNIKNLSNPFFKDLHSILNEYKNSILIPVSFAHLNDLNKNYEENKDKIDEDITYLAKISNNISTFINYNTEPEKIDYQETDLHEYFKSIRSDNSISLSENILNLFEDSFSKINLPFNIPGFEKCKTFWDLTKSGFDFGIQNLTDPTNYKNIRVDLQEKLKLKNTLKNMSNDAYHSLFGTACQIFITNDKTNYRRSKLLYNRYNLKTKIIKTFDNDINELNEIKRIIKN